MRPPATFADLANVPETMVGQIIDGALVVHPWPALPHVQTTSNVGGDINGRFARSRAPQRTGAASHELRSLILRQCALFLLEVFEGRIAQDD